MKVVRLILLLLLLTWQAAVANSAAGRVVWWGMAIVRDPQYSGLTNGVITSENEILTNIVAVAAHSSHALALSSDGRVFAFGTDSYSGSKMLAGLSNVASIAVEGNSCWAIKRDGTVAQWGDDQDKRQIVAGLSNITAIAWAGYRSYLALKNDGAVFGFRLDDGGMSDGSTKEPAIRPVRVRGAYLSNVVAMALMGYTPLVLKKDGTVFRLDFQTPGAPPAEPLVTKIDQTTVAIDLGGESRNTPYQYTTADPVMLGGQVLSNVTAIRAWGDHALALRSDGTVVSWGNNQIGETAFPRGLTNVVDVAHGLALKCDGTVIAWGDNHYGQTSVPAGLSNVVAIAAGDRFSLAVTTGSLPASIFIEPHGRLETMAVGADLIFKGQVLSSARFTNAGFRNPQMDVHATKLKVISVLKGGPTPGTVIFQHYTTQPGAWGGVHWPPYYKFEVGQCYLIFAARLDKADKYYSPLPGATAKRDEFRQIADFPTKDDDGVLRCLDAQPLGNQSIKDAHWHELNLLLNHPEASNRLYAIQHLDAMSLSCAQPWDHNDDFSRDRVLKALSPRLADVNDQVAVAAIDCFHAGSECASQLESHAAALIGIATRAPSIPRRAAAIAAFSGTAFPELTNSIATWLSDPSDEVRAQALLLLPDFPGAFARQALRRLSEDDSPRVRASVADAIGNGTIQPLLPTLVELFQDPVGRTNPVPPLTIEELRSGGRTWRTNNADVHTSAGYALLKFDLDQVAEILKTNLADAGFRPNFLCKLAEKNAGPWLNEMALVMEARRNRNRHDAEVSGVHPNERYFEGLMALSGTYFKCWNIIFEYLREQPTREFVDGRFNRYLDVLENAGTTGSREPVMIYELYRTKGLERRAANYRRRCEDSFSYDIGFYFKQLDARLKDAASKSAP